MQRQKSILSFMRPSSGNQSSGNNNRPLPRPPLKDPEPNPTAPDLSMEVRGTDTPPEKLPRQFFPPKSVTRDASLVSSIMNKFIRVNDREDANGRNQGKTNSFNLRPASGEGNVIKSNKVDDKGSGVDMDSASVDDILGPETPGMRPLVPRFKRIQEEIPKLDLDSDCSTPNQSKRAKLSGDFTDLKEKDVQVCDPSKFDWLNPSQIQDSNQRRPEDPLYDKSSLYIPPDVLKKMSASQKQYWSIKCRYMDVVLFFKVGKFYELYELDAEIGNRELGWKVTLSGVGKCRQVGISESGIEDAVQKLVYRGYKVGRVEQTETSYQAKARGASSVISRRLVSVVTPSTLVDSNIGPDAVHLLVIKEAESGLESVSTGYGFAFVDCAALRFWVGSINDDASCAALGALLMQITPKEIIYESKGLSKEAQKAVRKYSLTGTMGVELTPVLPANAFTDASNVRNSIRSNGYLKRSAISWNHAVDGVVHQDLALCALGGLINHLSRLMLNDVLKNGDVSSYQVYRGCLRMDGQTLVNLEIFNNNADGSASGSLYKYLDNCVTSSGKRLLRKWICHPLKDAESINSRLDVVEAFVAQPETTVKIIHNLSRQPDLERLLGRVKSSLHSSLSFLLPTIGTRLVKQLVRVFGSLVKSLRIALDLLTVLSEDRKLYLLLSKIYTLPVLEGADGINKYLAQFDAAVDSGFPNYQNHDVADSDADNLTSLIELFIEKGTEWSAVIHAINCIDVLRSFAVTAVSSCGAMSRPHLLPRSRTVSSDQASSKGQILQISGLWHPYALGENGGLPIPNDILLGEDKDAYHPHTLLLTGPNMGGKSTLLRATCLAVILAQLGCYVPCENCVLSPVDTIFTRLGATDRIMIGESTFFIECSETASVLQNATEDSLVILDELGRGTSTFDGYAIAYAVFRHLVEKVNCRLLFATHYHPLTKEFGSHPRVNLQHMACAFKPRSENEGDLVFLYKLASGACPESYGLQVALMAGIPKQVVGKAPRAAKAMERMIRDSFKSSEQRLEFSSLHEDWMRNLLGLGQVGDDNMVEEDTLDTLYCLWHEVKIPLGRDRARAQ